jgi:hypothetical protein
MLLLPIGSCSPHISIQWHTLTKETTHEWRRISVSYMRLDAFFRLVYSTLDASEFITRQCCLRTVDIHDVSSVVSWNKKGRIEEAVENIN